MSRGGHGRGSAAILPILLPMLVSALACGPRLTSAETIELRRSLYRAELRSLAVKQDPVAAGAGAPAVRSDAILQVVVTTAGQQDLPGVTLDVRQVGADRHVKERRQVWVETAGLGRGGETRVTHVMENVDWDAGDGFVVEVRTPIPAAERAAYREFEPE
jgi:hypothetical protein